MKISVLQEHHPVYSKNQIIDTDTLTYQYKLYWAKKLREADEDGNWEVVVEENNEEVNEGEENDG